VRSSGMYLHTTPQSRCPPQPFSPLPGSMFLYYISYKRQHVTACARQVRGSILQKNCRLVVVLSRYVSSPVVALLLVIRKTSNNSSRKNRKSKNQSMVPPTRVGKTRNHLSVLPFVCLFLIFTSQPPTRVGKAPNQPTIFFFL